MSMSPLEEIQQLDSIQCGTEAARHFAFDEGYRNLNHGSFGTAPVPIRKVLRHFQEQSEARPDAFIRYEYPKHLDESRKAIADYLHAPVEACVFVSNATTGTNTVLRNLVYESGDVIIYFATIYGALEKTVSYITETTAAEVKKIKYTYPVSDGFLCDAFEATVKDLKKSGKNPKVAILDTIVSLPGVRMPFERLTELCRRHNVLSLIDGAHGVGHIPLNLSELDPDFFVSNLHKWLHVPRGCSVFYVPARNQHLIRSTVPTSHGFRPLPQADGERINNPLPPTGKSDFVTNFEFVGTLDDSPYLCVPAALEWRKKLTWDGLKGEGAVFGYCSHLAHQAGQIVSSMLGTEMLENEERTLGKCNMVNVRLPLSYQKLTRCDTAKAVQIDQWIARTLVAEYKTFIAIITYGEAWWVRLSSQVYLTEQHFEWAGKVLKEICKRVEDGEWKKSGPKL